MPCGKTKNCVTCHNLESSLIIMMNNGDQYTYILLCDTFFKWMTIDDVSMASCSFLLPQTLKLL